MGRRAVEWRARYDKCVQVRRISDDDLGRLAADAARYQTDPSRATCYLSADEPSILTEFDNLERPFVGALAEDSNSIHGWVIGELDLEIGRVWWLGPFSERPATADAVYRAAKAQLPREVNQEELAADISNSEFRRFAERHGFTTDPASVALTRPVDRRLPQTRSRAGIRPLAEADHPALIALHDRAFPDGHYTGAGLVDRAPHTVLVAEVAGVVVGYIAVERQADGSAYIDFLGVEPAQRRAGFATDLVIAACAWAREQSASHIHLTVRETLEGARKLYESVGFEPDLILVPYRKGFTII